MIKIKQKMGNWLIVLFKSSKIMGALKALKALKSLKALMTLGSMVLSVFAYSFSLGWKFAAGLVVMIFIHEMGHVIACRAKNIPASAPFFIPFFGAAIFIPAVDNREDEAFIGMGGPLVGGLAAILCFFVYLMLPQKHEFLLMVSYIGTFINLFNMVPIRPLDGGRITQVVAESFKYFGAALLLVLTLMIKEPGLLLIWIIVVDSFDWKNLKHRAIMNTCLLGVMITLILMHIGAASMVEKLIDVFLGFVICLLDWVAADRSMPEDNGAAKRPVAPPITRLKWLGYYAVLTILLVTVLGYQASLIPPQAKGH
jgi:Zn-dependent protease